MLTALTILLREKLFPTGKKRIASAHIISKYRPD
jgi:hypothetical protein